MVLVELVVIPLFWILFNVRSWEVVPLVFGIVFLGTIGFCVLGTLLSAVTLRARNRELLLPLVLLPLMIPVILATIRCMETALRAGQIVFC
jgi:heme exporter protein B